MAEEPELEDDAETPEDAAAAKPAPSPAAPKRGKLGAIIAVAIATVLAGGLGAGLGLQTASVVEQTIAERARAKPAEDRPQSSTYAGDVLLVSLQPVITNLAEPSDVWIRLETSIVVARDALENTQVTSAEIQQDILAYARTVKLAQLEGPSALQHLREDLNERVSVRTGGKVNELIIQSLVVQ